MTNNLPKFQENKLREAKYHELTKIENGEFQVGRCSKPIKIKGLERL